MFATKRDKTAHNHNKHPLIVGCLLLGLAAIPDAMVVPVLHNLTVEKYGVSTGAAHYFMAVNLLGALFAIGFLAFLKRRLSSTVILFYSAIVSAILMACMAITTSWWLFLIFRCLEGGADLLFLSIPFRIIAGAGGQYRYGGRIGAGFMVMMIALAIGAGSGVLIGSGSGERVLWVGSAVMAILALIVTNVRRTINNLPASPKPEPNHCPLVPREWLGAGFMALDRCLSAIVSTSLPILLASGFNIAPTTLGIALAGMFLSLAAFSVPVGVLADKVGGSKIRLWASVMCGIALVGLGLMVWLPPSIILVPCLLMYGVGAAGLMPSAFSATVRQNASNLVFSSIQAAGQCGYALGVIGGGLLISVVALPTNLMLSRLFPIAGGLFFLLNAALLYTLRIMKKE